MKRKTLIENLKAFADGESREILDFIQRFENAKPHYRIKKKYKVPKQFYKRTYEKYLKSSLWRDIRNRVFDKKGRNCEGCGSIRKLQVHHSVYRRDILLGKSLYGLRVVCDYCHEEIHKIINVNLRVATKMILDKPKKVEEDALTKELEYLNKMKKNI